MTIWMTAFSAGAIILYFSGLLLPFHFFIVVLASFFVVRAKVFWILFTLSVGWLYASAFVLVHQERTLPHALEGVPVELNGYLCDLPVERAHYTELKFCSLSLRSKTGGFEDVTPRTFKLFLASTQHIPERHLLFHIHATLKRPHASLNPVVGSYEKQLFFERIAGTGSVVALSLINTDDLNLGLKDWFRVAVLSLRQFISRQLDQNLIELEHKGVIRALVLGDRSQMTVSELDVLSQSGTQHLLAISGLHVGIVMSLCFIIFRKGRKALWISAGLGLIYILLVGFGASAQRAWVMMLIGLYSVSGNAPAKPFHSMACALFFVLLIDPLSPLSSGFWYSFFAVSVLLLLYKFKLGGKSWSDLLHVQVILFLALFPLNALFAMPHSSTAIPANLVAIPWISIVVLPAVLFCSMLICIDTAFTAFGFAAVNEVLHVLFAYLSGLVAFNEVGALETKQLRLAGFWVCLFSAIVLWRFRPVVILLSLVLLAVVFLPTEKGGEDSEFWVFDVGQGLSIVVRSNDAIWLYDLGPATERASAAKRTLIPFLRSRVHQAEVDGLILSHGDLDHAGGWSDFHRQYFARELWLGEAERIFKGDSGEPCEAGMHWEKEGLGLEVLFPYQDFVASSSNNRSCVVRIELEGVVFLVMGDLEGDAEIAFVRHMLESAPNKLKADVLIAGHHGASKASSYRLLKHVQPEYIVFSAGYRNRFGHPSESAKQRADNLNILTLNTAEEGAIKFYPNALKREDGQDDFGIITMRELKNDYWLDQKASLTSSL